LDFKRIPAVDGLRTVAVLGVLWVHTWGFFNNIPLKFGLDFNRFISLGRNGVDLFFVISGFCMFLMYGSKIEKFSFENFTNFLKKRLFRIAPAFYILIAVESCNILFRDEHFPFQDFIYHLLFINIYLPLNLFSPIYWSLSTEFHFYLIFPLLFLGLKRNKDFLIRVLVLMVICMILRIFLFYFHRADISVGKTIHDFDIWFRFLEFGFGIVAAVLFINNKSLPAWLLGSRGFLIGLLISFLGRLCSLTELANYFGKQAFILMALSQLIMAFGFGLILLNVISSPSLYNRILSCKPFLFLGKISYSMYLWHYLMSQFIANYIKSRIGISNVSMNISLLLTLAILIPVSWISFKILEEPYFKRNKNAKELSYVEVF
jgi:peptidoglycan/LPS O-acetylase OafA/YrhL